MPRELLKVHVHCRRKKNVQRVLVIRRFATSAMRDFDDIAPLSNQSFRQQKPGGKFIITPRCPHRYSDAAPAHADFQRLFHGQRVATPRRPRAGFPAHNLLDLYRQAMLVGEAEPSLLHRREQISPRRNARQQDEKQSAKDWIHLGLLTFRQLLHPHSRVVIRNTAAGIGHAAADDDVAFGPMNLQVAASNRRKKDAA